jgi:hypothetical protein
MAVPLANGDRIGHPVRDERPKPSSAAAASTTRRLAVQPSPNPPPAAATPPDGPGSVSGGPNLGWALACAGLLLAAGLLGLTEGGRGSSGRGRGHLTATLRPLFGRR